ncbi:DegT/DnrJ/EryC1/StrS family aminotransferase [Verrucomicrobia bacterium]|nr:DegT/DnrJ/EryC1/StrS family aminotransferase [Verrucomicrobiota bacterium]
MGVAELSYVQQAFDQNWLSTVGPNLTEVENIVSEQFGLPALALASGTAGIHLGLKLLGVKPEDEVIVPSLTFVAGCNPVLYEHARPVFIDSENLSWNLDPQQLQEFLIKRAKVNRLPRVVTVAHLFGQSADLDAVIELCRRYEIPLLEDAAESMGTDYKGKPTGTFGEVGVFSFNGNKMITATAGGMLVSRKSIYIDRARRWSTQSRDEDPEKLNNYIHSELGYNYRMSNVLAGIALGQLEVLDKRVGQRRAVFNRYRQAFSSLDGIKPQQEAPWGNHTRWLSCFLVDETEFGASQADIIRYLESQSIESRPVWKPLHTQPLFQGYECVGGEVAEDLNRRGICLPSSSSLTEEDQQRVIDCIKSLHRSSR